VNKEENTSHDPFPSPIPRTIPGVDDSAALGLAYHTSVVRQNAHPVVVGVPGHVVFPDRGARRMRRQLVFTSGRLRRMSGYWEDAVGRVLGNAVGVGWAALGGLRVRQLMGANSDWAREG
jgi:hypothetical protein